MSIPPIFRGAALAAGLSLLAAPALAPSALAQSAGPGWFVPPAAGGGAAPRPAAPPAVRPAPRPVPTAPLVPPPLPATAPPGAAPAEEVPPPQQAALPPMPELPQLPRGSTPPASVIGVISVPDIMRASLAAKQIEQVITERREKLNQDAQKEQAAWRELQQQLANSRAAANAEQVRAKEHELQDRITNAQKQFRDRNRVIQESLQFGLAQIEQVLSGIVRQVAESRGMNLVLHRAQVVLNYPEFDMTDQVTEQLNKVLPTVVLPPDGVSPATFSPPKPVAQATPPGTPAPTPASAPAPAPAPAPAAQPASATPPARR